MPGNIIISSPTKASARVIKNGRPDLPKRLFWDTAYEVLDWKGAYHYVIQRVIDRGEDEDYEALIRYYGRDKVIETLKSKITYLMDHSIQKACDYFSLKPEELRCYIKKQSRRGLWL